VQLNINYSPTFDQSKVNYMTNHCFYFVKEQTHWVKVKEKGRNVPKFTAVYDRHSGSRTTCKITEGCRLLFHLQPSVIVLQILKRNSAQLEFQESNNRLQHIILPTGHISAKISGGFWLVSSLHKFFVYDACIFSLCPLLFRGCRATYTRGSHALLHKCPKYIET
jgi:hypothetical protein